MPWPDKILREDYEIKSFIKGYQILPEAIAFEIVSKGEKPDYVLRNILSGAEVGVELTSVYLSDTSVPEEHIPSLSGPAKSVELEFDRDTQDKYLTRISCAISTKIKKSAHYDLSRPLILAVFLNEYATIFLQEEDLNAWAATNEALFDSMSPFREVVLHGLPNDGVFRIRPDGA